MSGEWQLAKRAAPLARGRDGAQRIAQSRNVEH
jgi:hypothetical protein